MDANLKKIIFDINTSAQSLATATAKLNQYAEENADDTLSLKELAEKLQKLRLS